jgi:hypothetical protein
MGARAEDRCHGHFSARDVSCCDGSTDLNVGTFGADAATVITHNHASTSNDDCFGS